MLWEWDTHDTQNHRMVTNDGKKNQFTYEPSQIQTQFKVQIQNINSIQIIQLYSQVYQRVSSGTTCHDVPSESTTLIRDNDYVNWRPASYSMNSDVSSSLTNSSGNPPFVLREVPQSKRHDMMQNGLLTNNDLSVHKHQDAEIADNPGYMLHG